MSEEFETAHNNLCLEVQRMANEFAQMRLALTLLVQRVERCEEELRLRRLTRRQSPVTVTPIPQYWTTEDARNGDGHEG